MIGRTNTGGGGGGGLNFKVVGGTTAPSNPKANMIWINTDVKITSYDFNAIEPETPVQGMVWISVGTSSAIAFNALKKNGIQVYPISAKQYVSGAWVDVTAKSYQNGEWVDWWNGELYWQGNEYTHLTGGWAAIGKKYSSSSTTPALVPTVTKHSDHMYAKMSSSGAGLLVIDNAIDLTNYNYLIVEGEFYYSGSVEENWGFYIWTSLGTYYSQNMVALDFVPGGKTVNTMRINVSTLSGEYFVGFVLNSSSNGTASYIDLAKCYLE